MSASALRRRNGRAPDDDLDLVVDPVPDEAVERQGARHLVDEGEHVGAERRLQLGVLVEVVEHDLGDGVALEHDDEALAGAARGLVADVGDAGDLAVLDEVGDLERQHVRVDLVGQLGDDEALAVLDLLDLDDRAHDDRAAARAVGVLDALVAHDQRAGREVRALDDRRAAPRGGPRARCPGGRGSTARRPRPRAGCAAGSGWPCRRRCRPSR